MSFPIVITLLFYFYEVLAYSRFNYHSTTSTRSRILPKYTIHRSRSSKDVSDKLEELPGKGSTLFKSEAAKFGIDTVLAVGFMEEGLLDEAEKRAREAVSLGEHTGEVDNIYAAYAEGILGDVLYKMGSVDEAAHHYRAALTKYEIHYRSSKGPEAVQMLGAAQMLSWKLLADQNYKEAINACTTALGLTERLLGPHAPDVATCMFNLGTAFLNSGDTGPRAEAMFKQAANIYMNSEPLNYDLIGKTLGCLGNLYFERNDFESAKIQYLEVTKLVEKGLFQDVEAAATLKNLGGIFWREGNLDNAEKRYSMALKILQESELYGPHDELTKKVELILKSIKEEKLGVI